MLIRSNTESEEETDQEKVFGMQPYLFEPQAASTSTNLVIVDAIEVAETPTRIGNTDWCKCAECVSMAAEHDCLCCKEIEEITEKKFEGTNRTRQARAITSL